MTGSLLVVSFAFYVKVCMNLIIAKCIVCVSFFILKVNCAILIIVWTQGYVAESSQYYSAMSILSLVGLMVCVQLLDFNRWSFVLFLFFTWKIRVFHFAYFVLSGFCCFVLSWNGANSVVNNVWGTTFILLEVICMLSTNHYPFLLLKASWFNQKLA